MGNFFFKLFRSAYNRDIAWLANYCADRFNKEEHISNAYKLACIKDDDSMMRRLWRVADNSSKIIFSRVSGEFMAKNARNHSDIEAYCDIFSDSTSSDEVAALYESLLDMNKDDTLAELMSNRFDVINNNYLRSVYDVFKKYGRCENEHMPESMFEYYMVQNTGVKFKVYYSTNLNTAIIVEPSQKMKTADELFDNMIGSVVYAFYDICMTTPNTNEGARIVYVHAVDNIPVFTVFKGVTTPTSKELRSYQAMKKIVTKLIKDNNVDKEQLKRVTYIKCNKAL